MKWRYTLGQGTVVTWCMYAHVYSPSGLYVPCNTACDAVSITCLPPTLRGPQGVQRKVARPQTNIKSMLLSGGGGMGGRRKKEVRGSAFASPAVGGERFVFFRTQEGVSNKGDALLDGLLQSMEVGWFYVPSSHECLSLLSLLPSLPSLLPSSLSLSLSPSLPSSLHPFFLSLPPPPPSFSTPSLPPEVLTASEYQGKEEATTTLSQQVKSSVSAPLAKSHHCTVAAVVGQPVGTADIRQYNQNPLPEN